MQKKAAYGLLFCAWNLLKNPVLRGGYREQA